jgi:hypothetical protein
MKNKICMLIFAGLLLTSCEQTGFDPNSFFSHDPVIVQETPPDPLLPPAPEKLTVTAFDGSMTVSWLDVEGALSYEVFYGTEQTPPEMPVEIVSVNSYQR